MRVVVLGHARSGTGYTAACFRQAGWDVGHECLGADGISSWMWAVQSAHVPWGIPRLEPLEADVILHIMREPAAAVSSIAFTEQTTEDWRGRWVDIPDDAEPIERAVWSLHGWTLMIRDLKPTHTAQSEHVAEAVVAIAGNVAWLPDDQWRNDRPHDWVSADEIKATVWKHPSTAQLWDRLVVIHEQVAP